MNSHHFRPPEARVLSIPPRRGSAKGERRPPAAPGGTDRLEVAAVGWQSAASDPERVAPESRPSVSGELSLDEAWQKVFRVRELFDVELATLRDQQAVLQLRLMKIETQEAAWSALDKLLAEREAQVSLREQTLIAKQRVRRARFGFRLLRLIGLQPAEIGTTA